MSGLFFDDAPPVKRKDAVLRELPPVPETGWRPTQPRDWPNLSAARYISFDTETKDPNIEAYGPGWARYSNQQRDGHIVGVSMTAEAHNGERCSIYLPMRHDHEPEFNLNPNAVLGYVNYSLNNSIEKVGANLTYDIGWLNAEGVNVGGRVNDIQFAEALIDNDAEVALDVQGRKYLNTAKTTDTMYDWIGEAYPNTPPTKRRKEIWRTSPRLVGPYAIGDSDLPLDIWKQQERILWNEGLFPVFRLECDIIPLMIAMRMRGVRVDLDHAEKLYNELRTERPLLYQKIYSEFGFRLESTSSANLGRLFEYVGIKVPRTEAGNYSVEKEWLAGLDHPAGKMANDIRENEKISGTFLKSYILDGHTNGRLHPQFHQLHNDESGTKVGRFSSSDPNLQNIPSRTKLGKRVREAFVPDIGHAKWRKRDFSQIHYRLLAHNAVDNGDGSADALRARYINDKTTDYHMDVYRNVAPLLGWNTDYVKVNGDWNEDIKFRRRPIKNVNFGLLYGQSSAALAYKSGFSTQQAKDFFEAYHAGAPYVKPTMELIGKEVQEFGFVTTLMGRRIRFPDWEPIRKDWDNPEKPLPFDLAVRKWGNAIKRAFEYRGVNYKFQGSEPDIMKSAMRDMMTSGVFNVTGVPLVTVHDELDFSVIDDSPAQREAHDYIGHCMENAVKLKVPIFADETNGPSWGKAD